MEWPVGPVTKGHILAWFPWGGTLVSRRVQGKDIIAACENSVSCLPMVIRVFFQPHPCKAFGKFGHFSGVSFEYTEKNEPGNRVHKVLINGEPLKLEEEYSVATTEYLAGGGDGYESLTHGHWIVRQEEGAEVISVLLAWFKEHKSLSLKLNGWLKNID